MAKFQFNTLVAQKEPVTARLGSAAGSANNLTDLDLGKAVTLAGDSRYNLCSTGGKIDGFISAVETYTAEGYTIGSVLTSGRIAATADGLESTGSTGNISIGDYVVAGTITAKGTALGTTGPKVFRAVNQPGATVSVAYDTSGVLATAGFAKITDQMANTLHAWKCVAIPGDTTGAAAVGTGIIIERVES